MRLPGEHCSGMAIRCTNEASAGRGLRLSGLRNSRAGFISAVLTSKPQFARLVHSQKIN